MDSLKELFEISRYIGQRFDLVQAGGGNSSVKVNGELFVKASGIKLSEACNEEHYAKLTIDQITKVFHDSNILNSSNKKERETIAKTYVDAANLTDNIKPSIEAFLHAKLYKFVAHYHPIAQNIVLVQKNWRNLVADIMQDSEYICADYATPGIDLAINLEQEMSKVSFIPKIAFLQNHGIIISADTKKEILKLIESVADRFEQALNLDYSSYKQVSKIAELHNEFTGEKQLAYLGTDQFITNNLLKALQKPAFPDHFVYNGITALELNDLTQIELEKFTQKYKEPPKVIIYRNNIYYIAKTINKARDMEEVLKSHIMAIADNEDKVSFIDNDELLYLGNWDAEKYRQNIS